MRVNCKNVLNAWRCGRRNKSAQSIWTDGRDIYSYGTCLVTRDDAGNVILNRTRYSVTTTIHQGALAVALNGCRVVDGIRIGCSPYTLTAAATGAK
jgi:hypothetical protein